MHILSLSLHDLWLFGTGAGRAEEILDYPHFLQETWRQLGKHNSSRPAARVKECKLLFQKQKK